MANNKFENQKEKLLDKINQYGITKKTLYSVISIFALVGFIFVWAFVQADFDPSKFSSPSEWVRFVILAGIASYSMVVGQQIGDDISRNNKKGAFRSTLAKYARTCEDIDSQNYFAYFELWLEDFREKKIYKKKCDYLKDFGVYQKEVLDLDRSDLDMLKSPYKKSWKDTAFEGKYENDETFFFSYTDEQIEAIKFCLDGKIKVSKLTRNFFCSVYVQSDKDMWESAAKSSQKKGLTIGYNYVYKLVTMFITSFIMTGLVVGQKDIDIKTVMLRLIGTLGNMLMALVWGIYIGFELVKIDTLYLDFKTDVLKQYLGEIEANIYKVEKLDNIAKRNYEEKITNEQEDVLV